MSVSAYHSIRNVEWFIVSNSYFSADGLIDTEIFWCNTDLSVPGNIYFRFCVNLSMQQLVNEVIKEFFYPCIFWGSKCPQDGVPRSTFCFDLLSVVSPSMLLEVLFKHLQYSCHYPLESTWNTHYVLLSALLSYYNFYRKCWKT